MEQVKVEKAEKQNRLSRELDTPEIRKHRVTSWRAPETLPSPDPRPGITHRYIRVSMLGTPDAQNISAKFREGYEPVKAEDYPELMMHASTEGRFAGNIEVGGLVLCSIPTEVLKQREAYFAGVNKQTMESVDNNFMKDSDPRMSKFSEKSTKVSFGSGST
jgi:hypothetical protein